MIKADTTKQEILQRSEGKIYKIPHDLFLPVNMSQDVEWIIKNSETVGFKFKDANHET